VEPYTGYSHSFVVPLRQHRDRSVPPNDIWQRRYYTLCAIDSEFGCKVLDFVAGQPPIRNDDYYLEGFAANLMDGNGLAVSNAATKTYNLSSLTFKLGFVWQRKRTSIYRFMDHQVAKISSLGSSARATWSLHP
jgi:hypothetical protein